MEQSIRLSKNTQELLQCPVCKTSVRYIEDRFVCTNPACGSKFPVVDGIPVLLNEQTSIFSIEDFVSRRSTFFKDNNEHNLSSTLKKFLPTISMNVKGQRNFARLKDILISQSDSPRVLIIGGSILGQGMETLVDPSLELVESDVSFGPRTGLISDAHDIPFEDGTFEGVVVQAVLEHVVDPYRCVNEIHRVLGERGVVYSEIPFIQQVHGGRYDFTRFTHLGHRRLFRHFTEIDSGAMCGPGMALAWSYEYFLKSFTTNRHMRSLLRLFSKFTAFYLKYFDLYLINKPGGLDAASGCYFLGRKSDQILPDRELIKLFRGI